MTNVEVLLLNEHAQIPQRASELAAGFDLCASNTTPIELLPGARALIPTGISIALPPYHEAQIRPRSGLAAKNGVTVLNSPGTIDADYRGEIKIILANLGQERFVVEKGMRVAQMVIAQVAKCDLKTAAQLSESTRGSEGFGSTGLF
jgi:dUTP pyrophosphatase